MPLDLLLLDRDPVEAVASIVQSLNATMLVLDVAYMRRYRDWRDRICDCVPESVTVIQVESEVVVPLQIVSNEVAGSMKLIRPKIMERLHKFLIELPRQKLTVPPTPLPDTSCQRLQQTGVESWLNKLKDIDRSVTAADEVGGCSTAEKTLQLFTTCSGDQYPTDRNKPVNSGGSDLSPFLRFGHLSPVRVALVVSENIRSQGAVDSFLNEVIVRRELSHNFVFFNRYYDNYDDALPEFSKTTLRRHVKDQRYYIYTREQLEAALTHDVYWNAAQVELVCTGRIPNVMRMYWSVRFLLSFMNLVLIRLQGQEVYRVDRASSAGVGALPRNEQEVRVGWRRSPSLHWGVMGVRVCTDQSMPPLSSSRTAACADFMTRALRSVASSASCAI